MPTPYNTSNYNYPLFAEIWPTVDDFLADYNISSLKCITTASATILYNLLIGKFYNAPINMDSIGQWKQQVMVTIYCYGPTWEKRSELQSKLRNLTDDDLLKGSRHMVNIAANPSTPVDTDSGTMSDKELNYIQEQNVSLSERSKVEAYNTLYDLLKTDITTQFIDRFDNLFLKCVSPQRVPYFIYSKED